MAEDLISNRQVQIRQGDSRSEIIVLVLFAIATSVLWQFQIGYYILYPFTILGTWFHEISHGITAMILGADFKKLEIFANGSGVATYSGGVFLGGFGNAVVAAAGPLGPAIFGSIFIVSTKFPKRTQFILRIFALFLILSVVLWVRTLFGAFVILLFGIGIFFAAQKSSQKVQKLILQFLGVQAITSVYLSIGYLFSSGAEIGGMGFNSDTQVIQNELFLPYWFWAILILGISAFLLFYSLRSVYQKPNMENV
jgi:hypothetical protein